jgi:hypothetical protein
MLAIPSYLGCYPSVEGRERVAELIAREKDGGMSPEECLDAAEDVVERRLMQALGQH